jgi:hypothetical protein
MALFVLTINNLSPAADAKHQELERVQQYGQQGLAAARAAGGALTSGNILAAGGSTIVGNWSYVAQAGS